MASIRGSKALPLRSTSSHLASGRRCFSFSQPRHAGYEDTIPNLRIGKHTRVIYQGFTGRVATGNAKDSLAYGTNIVGGVTPGKEGEHLGLPLLPDLKRAAKKLKPDATAVFVAAPQCGKAIEDAIEAEIPLIVAVAEHIPLHDILRVTSILNTQSKSRLVGANAPGIIAPIGNCRIGFQPLPTFAPGHVGIVAKSGTLSYETVASISRAGLGQSLCIGMGGDIVAGTSLIDALKVFEMDPETEAIVLVGEVGGRAEEEAADWIKQYRQRGGNKPIAALVGGVQAKPGKIMGHAGAWAAKGENTSAQKWKILENAGATMVDHPEKFGGVLTSLLQQGGKDVEKLKNSAAHAQQTRGYHTMRQRPTPQAWLRSQLPAQQKRNLTLRPDQAHIPLQPYLKQMTAVAFSDEKAPQDGFFLGVTVDRSTRQPCLVSAPTSSTSSIDKRVKRFPYDWSTGPSDQDIKVAITHAQLDAAPPGAMAGASSFLKALSTMYKEKEAITLSGCISITRDGSGVQLHSPSLTLFFDPSAYKSSKRQDDVHRLRQKQLEVSEEVEAEKDGIVFVKYDQEGANIGTLVNGAGLAMNTVDALRLHGGKATNFLDTGGKATSETVKKSFELVLKDPRIKVIFVNIFGGLTDGGMIADGIILAFKEVDMRGIPVVVRIRGTNEEVGQKKIANSGLGLDAFDDFAAAAKRVVELANQ
ncbi:succinyl-CoA ligase subunit alpha [Polychaeton citri CBS 116435]|uniref:Succinyl-CoA ligase subunit alpha n=1 Tax=Polychaeton citri CBS 116435 TaxID=1314669 RepID=A0A9P4QB85_9PEZI|nr:succinyl-CoA ligase subunit alpha [Polychaeton citri CBS 116435]